MLKEHNSAINIYCIQLSNFVQSKNFNLSLNILDLGIINIDKNGITEGSKLKKNAITLNLDTFKEILNNELTIIEAASDSLLDIQGDVLQTINLNEDFRSQKMNQLV